MMEEPPINKNDANQLMVDMQKFFAERGIYYFQVNMIINGYLAFGSFLPLRPRKVTAHLKTLQIMAQALGANDMEQLQYDKENDQIATKN